VNNSLLFVAQSIAVLLEPILRLSALPTAKYLLTIAIVNTPARAVAGEAYVTQEITESSMSAAEYDIE
jgi:hypothetical protein